MLKIVTPYLTNSEPTTKCGEIFCDHLKNVTISCSFCQIKLFTYQDFLLHIENEHFENITIESNEFSENEELNVENSDDQFETLECCEILYDYKENDEENNNSSEEEEENLNVTNIETIISKTIDEEQNHSEESSQLSNIRESDDVASSKQKEIETCPDCQEIFLLKKEYNQHVVEQHNGHKCPKCIMRFRHRHHLKRHLQNTHDKGKTNVRFPQRVNCPHPDCPKSFRFQDALNYHLEFHTMKCTFVCDFENCTKVFPSQQRLEQHQEKHTTARTFVCDYENCNKAYLNKRNLDEHRETHATAKRYICDNCGYSCSNTTTLKIHKRIHTGERPFPCKICEKSFISQARLYLHMNTHADIRPHVCQICQATFANRGTMKRHSLIHSEEKLFKCPLCDKAFKQPNGLHGHMRGVHGEPKPKNKKKMLKILPPCTLSSQTSTKCGEIFCDPLKNVTICCCFCQIKLFDYEDFLNHIQNEHFENIAIESNEFEDNEEFNSIEIEDNDNLNSNEIEDNEDYNSNEIEENEDYNSNEDNAEVEVENSDVLETLECCEILYDLEDNGGEEHSFEDESMDVETVIIDTIEKVEDHTEEPSLHSPKNEIDEPDSPKQKNAESSICPDCKELFLLKKDYDQHVVEQHGGHKCSKCDMRFRHRHHLKRHIQNIHDKGKTHIKFKQRVNCPYPDCPKSFSFQESLNYHLEFHTMKCTFVCDFENCTKAFPSQQRLEQHQEKHNMTRKFVCDFENCGKAYLSNQSLKAHKEIHAPAKRYICDNCGYSCSTSTALKIHKRTHTGERPFTCKICEKSFTSQATLHYHTNTHVTIRPHVCEICQATFTNRHTMKRHLLIHSEKKLFKCQLCDKAFKQPQCLDGHMRGVHWEPKPKKVKNFKSISNSSETTTTL
ncbi:zinc finger protein 62-like [Lucilia cuprina]|uniref:zinc finger protein 62-like n=1 Tax=Lucilia cuprina TaxID=7375 RepID=UPI001F067316|nr:zinc finger protein 62-like [Lucilia cuprina]